MLLSILIPSFNQGRYLAETLDSCLNQGYESLEVIVADGGSKDQTVQVLESYGQRYPQVRWVSRPDKGPADAVNTALAMARGEIAAIQSSDDIYLPGAFAGVARVFEREPDCGFVIGDYQGMDEGGRTLYTETLPEFSWEAYFARSLTIPQSSIFFRTSLAREIGGWDGSYYSPDIPFWLRLLLRTRAEHIGQVLSRWRIYPGQRTHSADARQRIWDGYWRMIAETPELHRASRRVRRLARASRHLLALRFHPTGERREVQRHLLCGFLQHPTFWRHYPWAIRPWLWKAANAPS